MSIIALNADELINEGFQGKKKIDLNDKVKVAMAVGVAAGVGVKSAVNAIHDKIEEDSISESEDQHLNVKPTTQSTTASETSENISVAEVNPDEVMLEEPVLESTIEEQLVEENRLTEEESVNQPFANNSVIEDVIYEESLPEELLYAQDVNSDFEMDDVICSATDVIGVPIEDLLNLPNDNYAWELDSYDEPDIQSDLMA